MADEVRLLFVCSYGKDRSATAAALYLAHDPTILARHGGMHRLAYRPVQKADVVWATTIVVFMPHHATQLRAKFAGCVDDKPVVCLGIDNRYQFGARALEAWIIREMRTRIGWISHPPLREA